MIEALEQTLAPIPNVEKPQIFPSHARFFIKGARSLTDLRQRGWLQSWSMHA
jgi:hypothetical protein